MCVVTTGQSNLAYDSFALSAAVAIACCREALELVGVQPDRVQAELQAREQAKLQRLYAAANLSAKSQPWRGSSSYSACEMVGSTGSHCSAGGRGSAEWQAAQAAYEDAHLGQFERIMPPDNPQLVSLGG
jgi:hypothetical protein